MTVGFADFTDLSTGIVVYVNPDAVPLARDTAATSQISN
jgi:hypothetical protein